MVAWRAVESAVSTIEGLLWYTMDYHVTGERLLAEAEKMLDERKGYDRIYYDSD